MIIEKPIPKSVIVHMDRFSLSRDLQLEAIQEFKELCLSSGTKVCGEVAGKIDRPSSNFFIRQGKLEEIKKGDVVYISENAKHALKNDGKETLKFYWIFPTNTFSEVEYFY